MRGFEPLLIEVDAEVPCLLLGPLGIRMRRRIGDEYLTGVDVNEEQDVQVGQSLVRPGSYREEVASPERGCMSCDKLVPRATASAGIGIEARGFEDVRESGAADLANAQLRQFTEDAGISPGVLAGHAENQLTDLDPGARPDSHVSVSKQLRTIQLLGDGMAFSATA